jgi:spore maturation protein CgeB
VNLSNYIYNLFYVKNAFEIVEHRRWVDAILSLDYNDRFLVNQYIDNSYRQILHKNKEYIFKLLKFDHDDHSHMESKFKKNIKENVGILLKGVF